jgi:large subunit ribosomal protein L19e
MKLNTQKRLASKITGASYKRIKFDEDRLEDIKKAITKQDLKGLIKDNAIAVLPKQGVSRGRAKAIHAQKKKGRRSGQGTRKGRAGARFSKKRTWINRVRLQRDFISELREKKIVDNHTYWELYLKVKGGFFRSKRHIKLYLDNIKRKV